MSKKYNKHVVIPSDSMREAYEICMESCQSPAFLHASEDCINIITQMEKELTSENIFEGLDWFFMSMISITPKMEVKKDE